MILMIAVEVNVKMVVFQLWYKNFSKYTIFIYVNCEVGRQPMRVILWTQVGDDNVNALKDIFNTLVIDAQFRLPNLLKPSW